MATAADGLLLVDKDAGMTSHDVVACARALAATRKVGHAGTLDPMATGLLVLGIGKATRFLTYLVGLDKTYTATVRLGQETSTEDAQGEVTAAKGCPVPEQWPGGGFLAGLGTALAALTGDIQQVPSAVSALKVDGVRAYARVRQGQQVRLAARAVTIRGLEPLGPPRAQVADDGTAVVDLDLRVSCSSGTYVRALARDLGQALGTGAHLTALRRTRVGPFLVEQARTLSQLGQEVSAYTKQVQAGQQAQALATLPLAEAARRCHKALELDADQARAVSHGQRLDAQALVGPDQDPGVCAGFAPDGRLMALLVRKGSVLRPVLVLEPAGGQAQG